MFAFAWPFPIALLWSRLIEVDGLSPQIAALVRLDNSEPDDVTFFCTRAWRHHRSALAGLVVGGVLGRPR